MKDIESKCHIYYNNPIYLYTDISSTLYCAGLLCQCFSSSVNVSMYNKATIHLSVRYERTAQAGLNISAFKHVCTACCIEHIFTSFTRGRQNKMKDKAHTARELCSLMYI